MINHEIVHVFLFVLYSKPMLLFCTICLSSGSVLYVMCDTHVEILFFSRLLSGVGSSNLFIIYSHITRVSKTDEQREIRCNYFEWIDRTVSLVGAGIGALAVYFTNGMVDNRELSRFTIPSIGMVGIIHCCVW